MLVLLMGPEMITFGMGQNFELEDFRRDPETSAGRRPLVRGVIAVSIVSLFPY